MTTPWAPPNSAGLPPQLTPPYAPHRGGPGLGRILAAFSALVIAAIAITAVVTAAIVRSKTVSKPETLSAASQFSAADQHAAKERLCGAFDAGERGNAGQGGVVVEGRLNIPVVLRMINTTVGVQGALSPSVPSDLSDAAKKFVAAENELAAAALANSSVDELTALTRKSNGTIDALADACGFPR